jgi:SprT-like family
MDGVYTPETAIDRHVVPTRDTYDALQHAYDHFNWVLFESELPNCLITLQRKGRSYGYFCRKRFIRGDGIRCDEIALNPIHFKTRSLEDILSTLVHEMVHLWQYHFGKSGRGRYHNRQWAEKMKSIGLQSSNTGVPGGNELGDQMTHYVIEEGPFARACAELINKDFKIEWQEDTLQIEPLGTINIKGGETTGDPVSEPKAPLGTKAGKRVKYTCPICGLNAWSRHDARLICGEDQLPMDGA